MHKDPYKIKVAFLCNKNFNHSIEELKLFFGFYINNIEPSNDLSSINSEHEVLIVDSSNSEKIDLQKINIPKVLILRANERKIFNEKFDLIIKLPLNINEFNQSIIDLSQKFKFDKNSLIKVKDYILDKNTRFLKKKDTTIKITEKEMHFIEELNNCTEPLTKDYILKNIWGYSSETDTHTVETHIYRLRQKIKNHFNDESFIKYTKKGYTF